MHGAFQSPEMCRLTGTPGQKADAGLAKLPGVAYHHGQSQCSIEQLQVLLLTPHQTYLQTRFFGSLDGLRFLCIALVLWHHMPLRGLLEDPPLILQRGFTGVDFFFVLSGYLITTLLLREQARNGRFSISGFYKRRILRIVPVYFLVVTLVVVYWIGVKGQAQYWAYVPFYYGFLANYLGTHIPMLSATWSLSVEEQYYLVWPLLLFLIPASTLWRAGTLCIVIGYFFLIAVGIAGPILFGPTLEIAIFRLPESSFIAILLGTLLAVILHDPKGFAVLYRLLSARWVPAALILVLIFLWQVLPGVLTGWPNMAMHSTMALILASLVVREDNGLAPLLQISPVARIGAISYGLYLWHLPVLSAIIELLSRFGLSWYDARIVAGPIYLVASILIAEVSFRYFESWFLRLKDRGKRPRPAPDD